MLKNILSVIIGVVGGSMTVFAIQRFSSFLHPLPPDLDFFDPIAFKEFIASLPMTALLLVILSHVLGAFLGSFFTARLAKSQKFNLGLLTTFILFIATISNFSMIPHPMWMMVVDLLGVLIMGFYGSKLGAGGVPDYNL